MILQQLAVFLFAASFLFVDAASDEGHAYSFQHFSGPTLGKAEEITREDEHGHLYKDYVGHPHYEYAYGVKDRRTGDYHGQKEHRDGDSVTGEYTVKEPTGNVRTVKYYADGTGFHAQVHNTDGN